MWQQTSRPSTCGAKNYLELILAQNILNHSNTASCNFSQTTKKMSEWGVIKSRLSDLMHHAESTKVYGATSRIDC